MRSNRKQRRASGIYRLDPLFPDIEREVLKVEDKTFYIDGKIGEYLVVSVPETTTRASASDLEQALSEIAKQPVLVVTHNMAFLRATLLTSKEKAELTEIIERATQGEEPTDADSPPQ